MAEPKTSATSKDREAEMERLLDESLKTVRHRIDTQGDAMSASDLKALRGTAAQIEKTLALLRSMPERRRKARAERDATRAEIKKLKAEIEQLTAQAASTGSAPKKPGA